MTTIHPQPLICQECGYPLEAGLVEVEGELTVTLRHPVDVYADHQMIPTPATCSLCQKPRTAWVIAFSHHDGLKCDGATHLCDSCYDRFKTSSSDLPSFLAEHLPTLSPHPRHLSSPQRIYDLAPHLAFALPTPPLSED